MANFMEELGKKYVITDSKDTEPDGMLGRAWLEVAPIIYNFKTLQMEKGITDEHSWTWAHSDDPVPGYRKLLRLRQLGGFTIEEDDTGVRSLKVQMYYCASAQTLERERVSLHCLFYRRGGEGIPERLVELVTLPFTPTSPGFSEWNWEVVLRTDPRKYADRVWFAPAGHGLWRFFNGPPDCQQ